MIEREEHNRIALIVHPHWVSVDYENSYAYYKNIIKKYDEVIILSPVLNDETILTNMVKQNRKELTKVLNMDEVTFVLTSLVDDTAMGIMYGEEHVNISRAIYSNGIKIGNLKEDEVNEYLEDTSKHPILLDSLYTENTVKEVLDRYKDLENVSVFEHGYVGIYKNTIFDILSKFVIESGIDVFGEYSNQCVMDILEVVSKKYDAKLINEYCISYNLDNFEQDTVGGRGSIIMHNDVVSLHYSDGRILNL